MIIRDDPSRVLVGGKTAILINPPIYDTQYWAYWSQPHGLLKVATWLKKNGYSRLRLIDCLATDTKRHVTHRKRQIIERDNIHKQLWEFGMSLDEMEKHLRDTDFIPDEIWITSIMTYWWESTRDVINRVKKVYPHNTPRILVGGIYPTLFPEHADKNLGKETDLDIVIVDGEISHEAANSWTDLSLYEDKIYATKPRYALVTGSRGCPFDCAYCAQVQLNHGMRQVKNRTPDDIGAEIEEKYKKYGVREIAFYEDNLLFNRDDFLNRLKQIRDRGLKITIYAPEGIEPRLVEPELINEMRATGFRKLHLALETIDNEVAKSWNRRQATIEKFEHAVEVARQAGWTFGSQDLNAFVIFGIPGEDLQATINTALYASHTVGSVIPMLFTPVPGSIMYKQHQDYLFSQKTKEGRPWDLQDLNGKLLPFLEYNREKYPWLKGSDYLNLESLMMHLNNSKVLQRPFDFAASHTVARTFRNVIAKHNTQSVKLSSSKALEAT